MSPSRLSVGGIRSERIARMLAGPLQGRGGMGTDGKAQVWEVGQRVREHKRVDG